MYLYIALILSLATATGFALLAAKSGRDYNRLLQKHNDEKELCKAWMKTSQQINRMHNDEKRKLKEFKSKIENREKCIAELTRQVNSLKESSMKAGTILQSCGSVDCDGKPNYCKECTDKASSLFKARNVCK